MVTPGEELVPGGFFVFEMNCPLHFSSRSGVRASLEVVGTLHGKLA